MNRAESGRLGGLATLKKQGVEALRAQGATGGRPPKMTISERLSQIENRKKEVANSPKLTIKQMRELWDLELEALGLGRAAMSEGKRNETLVPTK